MTDSFYFTLWIVFQKLRSYVSVYNVKAFLFKIPRNNNFRNFLLGPPQYFASASISNYITLSSKGKLSENRQSTTCY